MNRTAVLIGYTAGAAAQTAIACLISVQFALVLGCWFAVGLLVLLAVLRGRR